MKVFRNVLYWGFAGLLIAGILIFSVPKVFGVQFRAVTTGSMEPERPVGCVVVIVPTPFEKIGVGDDIAFVADEKLTVVTHRVAQVNEETQGFVTRGIANNANDPKEVSYENVLGKISFSVNGLGYVISWLDPLPNKIIAMCAIVAIVALSLLFTGEAGKKEKSRQGADKKV